MRVMTARVGGGKIVVDAEFQEGTTVAVLAADETGFRLTPEEEDELVTALASIRAGDYVDGRQLLQELKRTASR